MSQKEKCKQTEEKGAVVVRIVYPRELLERLEQAISVCPETSGNYLRDKREYDILKAALDPVLEIRNNAIIRRFMKFFLKKSCSYLDMRRSPPGRKALRRKADGRGRHEENSKRPHPHRQTHRNGRTGILQTAGSPGSIRLRQQ